MKWTFVASALFLLFISYTPFAQSQTPEILFEERTVESHYEIFGDFNGDGLPDLISHSRTADNDSFLVLGRWEGDTFRFADVSVLPQLLSLAEAGKIVAGDFNGDGFDDIAQLSPQDPNVKIALGSDQGVSENLISLSMDVPADFNPDQTRGLLSVDHDGDGIDSVLVTGVQRESFYLYQFTSGNAGLSGVELVQTLEPSSAIRIPYINDYDGNGIEDILLLSAQALEPHSLWLGQPVGTLLAQPTDSPTPKQASYDWDPDRYSVVHIEGSSVDEPVQVVRVYNANGGFSEDGEPLDQDGNLIVEGELIDNSCKDLAYSPLTRKFEKICLSEEIPRVIEGGIIQPDCPPLQSLPEGEEVTDNCYQPPITPNDPPSLPGGSYQPVNKAYTIQMSLPHSGSNQPEWPELYESTSPSSGYSKVFGGLGQGYTTTRTHSTYGFRYYKYKICSYHECSSLSPYKRVYVYTSPGPVQNLTVSPISVYLNGSATLQWQKAGGIVPNGEYRITEVAPGGARTVVKTVTQPNASQSNFSAMVSPSSGGKGTYTYEVRACNPENVGCGSTRTRTVTLKAPSPPGAPSVPGKAFANTNYSVSWGTGTGGATSYKLTGEQSGVIAQGTSRSSTRNKPTGTYYYKVQACNTLGCGDYSPTSSGVQVVAKPGAPSASVASVNDTGGAISVSWSAVSGATSYAVRYKRSSGTYSNAVSKGTSRSHTFPSLSPGKYQLQVKVCLPGNCAWSQLSSDVDIPFTIKATSGAGGSISPSSRLIHYGDTGSYTVSASSGYQISNVTGCGGTLSGGTYTTGNITSICSVSASFSALSRVGKPIINPTSGTYTGSKTIEISSATAGANIYFTTNGANPTTSSSQYTAPIVITTNTTLKAKAFKSGLTSSSIATEEYTIRPHQPSVNPNGGEFVGSATVTLSTSTEGATLYYTTDGTTPTVSSTEYVDPFELKTNSVVKARAYKANMGPSLVTSSQPFSITGLYMVTTSISGEGNIEPASQQVEQGQTASFALLPGVGYIVESAEGCAGSLDENVYTIGPVTDDCQVSVLFSQAEQVQAPVFTPDGGQYAEVQTVSLHTSTPDAQIYYSLNASSLGELYQDPIEIGTTSTVYAIAKSDGMADSDMVEATFTFDADNPDWAKPNGEVADANLSAPTAPASNFSGATPASGSADGGAAGYQIPITLPPGRAGMQPNVALSYSSRSGNGIAGVGFSLSAGGSISRCPSTLAQDGFYSDIQYDLSTDKLCLDGQRLKAISGVYGNNGTEYRTELDSMVRVIQRGGSINSLAAYFEVHLPNNHIQYYGQSAKIRAEGKLFPMSWLLDKEMDFSGNRIDYSYDSVSSGEVLLEQINYTGDASGAGDREVRFAYESRPDKRSQYLAGGKTRQTRRLKTISTWYAGSKVRDYSLAYQPSVASERSLLKSITECGYQGANICRQSTDFDWSDTDTTFTLEELKTAQGNELIPTDGQIVPDITTLAAAGDINGDGVRDWGSYFVNAEGGQNGINDYQTNSCEQSYFLGRPICVNADFDLDGRTDIWWVENGFLKIGLTDYPSHVVTQVSTNVTLQSDMFREDNLVNASDYNGDGWPDLVVGTKIKNGSGVTISGRVSLYLHSTNPLNPYPSEQEMVDIGPDEILQYLGDMDGNGLPDLAVTRQDPHESSATLKRLLLTQADGSSVTFVEKELSFGGFGQFGDFSMLLDVNGDGLPDWLGWMAQGLSDGDDGGGGFIPNPPPIVMGSDTADADDVAADYDRYEQQIADENGYFMVKLNKGNGEFTDPIDLGPAAKLPTRVVQTPISTPQEPIYEVIPKFSESFKVADINGDGVDELLFPDDQQILASGCFTFRHYPIGSGGTAEETTRCGSAHYGSYFGQDGTRISMSSIWDTNIYRYQALQFVEQADGSIQAQLKDTDIIGAANNAFMSDGFGKGLPDLVFAYGCEYTTDCSVTPTSGSPMQGLTKNKVYVSHNLGATDKASPGSADYKAIDLLEQVQDGAGKLSRWQYLPLTTGQIANYYQMLREVVDNQHFNFASSMYAVSKFEQSNGVGGLNSLEYRYTDATYNFKGRGFRGFTGITVLDNANNISTETEFEVKFPYTSQIAAQRVYKQGQSTPFRTQINDWRDNPSYFRNGLYHIYNYQSVTKQYDINTFAEYSTVTNTVNDIDQFGNVLESSREVDDDTLNQIVETVTDYPDANESWPRRWKQRTVTKDAVTHKTGPAPASGTNNQQVVVTDVVWNTTHRKPQSQTVSGDGSSLNTAYIYNDYGLPNKITRTGTVFTGSAMSAATQNRVTDIYYSNNGQTTANDGYFPYQTSVKASAGKTLHSYQKTDPATGQPVEQTDASSVVTQTTYDALARPVEINVTGQPAQYLGYQNASGNHAIMKVVSRQAGSPESEEHKDLLGRTVHSRTQGFDGSWVKQDVAFNARGLKTSESQPYSASGKGETRYSEFDVLGRTGKKVTTGTHSDLTTTYSYSGLETTINTQPQDGAYLTMSRTYNSLEQLIETVDALNGTTQYLYDAGGNPILIKDANNNSITANYDALGRKRWVIDPNQGRTDFTYNDFGELEKELDANTKSIFYDMDQAGRVTQRIADGSTATFTWDSAQSGCRDGLLCSESENGSSKTYQYDYAARITHTRVTIDGQSYTTQTQYDGNSGKPKALVYPNNLTLGYEYNSTGYLSREYNAQSGYSYRQITAQDHWGNITHALIGDNSGQVESTNQYSAKTGQMLYSQVDSGGLIQYLNYSHYDSYGNLKEQQSLISELNRTESFTYDELQRLTHASTTGTGISFDVDYGYDAVGNIRYKSDYSTNSTSAYQYNTGNNKIKSIALKGGGSVSFGYDQKGNLTTRNGSTGIAYNVFNKPVQINKNGSVSLSYGADLSRVKQVRTTGGTTTTTWYIDKHYEVESQGGSTTQAVYISDVAIIKLSDTDKSIRFTHRDRLGSATTLTDHNGQVVARRHFDAFGAPRGGDWSEQSLVRLPDSESRRGFTGHEHLDEAELIHMNGRVYDYKVGRFLSVDPVIQSPGNSQSINPYSYIMNNPLAGTDPSGYCSAETGTRLKKCVDVEVTDSSSGDTSTKSLNSKHSDFKSHVADFVNSKLGNGAQINAASATMKSGKTMDLMGQATVSQVDNNSFGSFVEGFSSFVESALGNIGSHLPSFPKSDEDSFAGYFWNRVLDGDVRDQLFQIYDGFKNWEGAFIGITFGASYGRRGGTAGGSNTFALGTNGDVVNIITPEVGGQLPGSGGISFIRISVGLNNTVDDLKGFGTSVSGKYGKYSGSATLPKVKMINEYPGVRGSSVPSLEYGRFPILEFGYGHGANGLSLTEGNGMETWRKELW
ncbi:chitobiase/beta-hexosaminidase C-terminal domain-containing protein [Lacimicrobium alkaliphilum]|uniref:Fibronectin type-III domain-containing protein n=1 Tax=Lacimicrobium alkaliphilum TaxID=1526571 RepID=A0A0U3B850_9ALTE|nr:chitobiase/beta-hexosaminidase C-terminal domain-containing protein [Lacimicrobium alkaliphilum]ALS99737.1 hypothetical protein AT746_16665 [Lacimicrobium alkaliphilum]